MVLRGSISIGDIQAFFLYVGQVSDPLSRSSYIMTKFQETAAALGRIYEVIDTPSEIDNGKLVLSNSKSPINTDTIDSDSSIIANTSNPITHTGTIDFEHVDFWLYAVQCVYERYQYPYSWRLHGGHRRPYRCW